MPSIGSKTKTVRFYADDLEKIEELVSGGSTFSGAVHQLMSGGLGVPKKTIDGIKEMGELAGLSLAEMLAEYLRMMEDGELMYEDDGRILPMKEEWEEELEALCQEKGLSLEEVGRRTMAALRKGVL